MQRHLKQVGAARAKPDDCGVDAIVRSENASARSECRRNTCYAVNELSPCEAGLHGMSPSEMEMNHNCTPPRPATRLLGGGTQGGRCVRMGISKPVAQTALLLISAALTYAADKRDWKEGRLVSVETVEHRYQCVVSDEVYSYTMEYEKIGRASCRER